MEPRTLDQLIADARNELDDLEAPHLWSEPRLTALFNEAIGEANMRARLIVDSDTPEVCRIALEPGRSEYPLHPSIIVIRRAVLASCRNHPLTRATADAMDDWGPSNWRTREGTPAVLVRPKVGGMIVSPVPTQADTLELTVWRHPLDSEQLEDLGDDPTQAGIEAIHHPYLVHWVCHRALMKHDAETADLPNVPMYLEWFERHFGPRPTARQLQSLSVDVTSGSTPQWF